MDPISSLGIGAGAGAITQVASEFFKMSMAASKQRHEERMAMSEEGRKWLKLQSEEGDKAAKRGLGVKLVSFTSILAYTVVGCFFLLALFGGLPFIDMPTAYITEQAGDSFLWGLIELSPSVVVENVVGFVNFPEMRSALLMVIGFAFGIKGVSTGANAIR